MLDSNECYVVLGHLMSANGILGHESQLRVMKLLECVKGEKEQLIFFCGWNYRDDSDIKLAKALNDFFLKHNKGPHKIFHSDSSRDTVGDAVLLKYTFDKADMYIDIRTSVFEDLNINGINTIVHLANIANDPSVELNPNQYPVVGFGAFEQWCRFHGLGVIHGGQNALRFTPHFNITSAEIDLIIDIFRQGLIEFDCSAAKSADH